MVTEAKTENLSRYLFSAPIWWQSLIIMVVLGILVDVVVHVLSDSTGSVMYGVVFVATAVVAMVLTKPLVDLLGTEKLTWNRSALVALVAMVFSLFWTMIGFALDVVFAYMFGLGFIFAIRLLVLTAISDYRIVRMYLPAAVQTIAGVIFGVYLFGTDYLIPTLLSMLIFSVGITSFLLLFDRPLRKAHGISAMQFINAFLAHLTDGSKGLEEYFRAIGETVTVPETSFFFQREGKRDVLFVIPNLHPGPLSEIGGGNYPKHLHDEFSERETVFISHGCATHDFNLVSESECEKIAMAIGETRETLSYLSTASRPLRNRFGTVSILSQRFGNSILLVTTRSPEMTEDLDYAVGAIVMAEGQRWYENVGFVDAHNCMAEVTSVVLSASNIGREYILASRQAMECQANTELSNFSVGVSQKLLPFSREQGFGDMGVLVLMTEVAGMKTAYVLFDGNNVHMGVREILRDAVLAVGVSEAEIMTTDSHVVNTISGRNPVGMAIPAEAILPHLLAAVSETIADLSPAKVASATSMCRDVEVFGPSRMVQLSATVNAMVAYLLPLSVLLLLVSFLTTLLIFIVCI
jgi:putative membrane protein